MPAPLTPRGASVNSADRDGDQEMWTEDRLSAPGMSIDRRLRISRDLGAVYYRPMAIFLDRWQGAASTIAAPTRAEI